MKKIFFAAYSLDIGGIETALVTLINYLAHNGYDIVLALEKKQGIFLDKVSKRVKIIEYTPYYSENRVLAKVKNAIKRVKFILKYGNNFDCGISYATYSLPGAFMARTVSNNSILWVHNDYLDLFCGDEKKYRNFFEEVGYDKFRRIVFVSDKSRNNFLRIMNNADLYDKTITINNLINYKDIIKKSEEKISDMKKEDIPTFLFVGRHTEEDKRISRLIDVASRLKKEKISFRIIIIGDGKDTENYKNLIKEKDLCNEIKLLGRRKNPYPYFKISDSLILTSEHEGFPVVYVEAMILNLPIITTNVSDSEKIIEGKYGMIAEKNVDSIYMKMREFIKDGFKIKEKFDAKRYNDEIIGKIENIIEGG